MPKNLPSPWSMMLIMLLLSSGAHADNDDHVDAGVIVICDCDNDTM